MQTQEHEVIERCNLPMRQLFARDGELRDRVELLLEGEPMTVWQLGVLSRTFRQMVFLDKANGLSALCCNAIMEQMEERDRTDPIYMDEVYPYLKKEYWELNMNEVSYFKVHVQNHVDWSFTLERIEKGFDQKEKKEYLDLYPFEEEEAVALDEWEKADKCYRVYFERNGQYEQFMKQILLDGCADLSKV